MIMAEVLISLERRIGFGSIKAAWRCRQYCRAESQMQRDTALEVNRLAGIGAGRETHHAAAAGRGSRNRPIDRRRVERFAIPGRAERPHIEGHALVQPVRQCLAGRIDRDAGCGEAGYELPTTNIHA